MKIVIEVELENAEMRRGQQVMNALASSLQPGWGMMRPGDTNNVFDVNGNAVGHWFVTDEVGWWQRGEETQ